MTLHAIHQQQQSTSNNHQTCFTSKVYFPSKFSLPSQLRIIFFFVQCVSHAATHVVKKCCCSSFTSTHHTLVLQNQTSCQQTFAQLQLLRTHTLGWRWKESRALDEHGAYSTIRCTQIVSTQGANTGNEGARVLCLGYEYRQHIIQHQQHHECLGKSASVDVGVRIYLPFQRYGLTKY